MQQKVLSVLGGMLGYLVVKNLKNKNGLLRPPGAMEEEAFLATCMRCGKCVSACPYQAIKVGDASQGAGVGTPYLAARNKPCYLCPAFPCIKACPSGALQDVAGRDKVDMGEAEINTETCLSWQGMRCEVCYRACPFLDKALYVEPFRNTKTGKHAVFALYVNKQHCVGCGLCEYVCVTEKPSIVVHPKGR
ncbi:MAG: 4Fe-4S dicluster domain-containing protein [Clostridia bacterium]|nr:4Fe-4S dicluster domain-containing protein [Clostridia bacterium]